MCDLSFCETWDFMYLDYVQGPTTIRAKKKSVVFHAFGCTITVMVTPLSSPKTTPIKVEGVDIDSLNLITMDDLPLDEPDVNPGWITGLDVEGKDELDEDFSREDRERLPATNSKKASKRPFLFRLVHGDVLVFYGDDFEVMNVAKFYWQCYSLFPAVFFKARGNVFLCVLCFLFSFLLADCFVFDMTVLITSHQDDP